MGETTPRPLGCENLPVQTSYGSILRGVLSILQFVFLWTSLYV